MSTLLNVSPNPHIRDKNSTTTIMFDVILALIPASAFGVYNFGFRALKVILVTVFSAVFAEYLFQLITKRKSTINDLSAVVTGLLLALNLPHDIPYWMAIIGSFFAIIIVKQLFGGIGQNFMNPALAARCFLVLSFSSKMTVFTYDSVTGATPLKIIRDTGDYNLYDMFLGVTAGTIGETSVIAILLGAIYLLCKKVIDIRIPLSYLGSFSVFILLFGDKMLDLHYLALHLCGGGIMLCAFFMATDYVTAPITRSGKWIYGVLLGVLTGIFRIYGPNTEGVSFAILFCNLLVPLIEKYTMKKQSFNLSKKKEVKHE